MSDKERLRIYDLLDMIQDSIRTIQTRTSHITCGNDFLLTPDNSFILDGVCMKLIFIGESIKTIDKLSEGCLFVSYPQIPWKAIMKLRDLIAHHYFRIDSDSIYSTIVDDLPLLSETLETVRQEL